MRTIIRKGLHKKLWNKQSEKIRRESADWRGYTKCYTCDKVLQWKECQVGHFWHNKLDFDRRNLRVQCIRCNHFLGGNLGEYAGRLIAENGMEWFNQLKRDAAQYKAPNLTQLKQLLINLTHKE